MEKKFTENKPFGLLTNVKADETYAQFLAYWSAEKGLPPANLQMIIEDLKRQKSLQEFAQFEKSVKVILDVTNFRILYITDNINDLSGYTAKETKNLNILLFFYALAFDHLSFPIKIMRFSFKCREIYKENLYKNLKMTICGIKAKKKDGTRCRIQLSLKPIQFDENGITQITLITGEEITHLIKSDFDPYWCRISCGENSEITGHFINNQKMDMAHDIISEREKDVLRLIAKGMESKEIGSQLFISSNTVDNHRRNMIARTGARDTTALLQLCYSCGII